MTKTPRLCYTLAIFLLFIGPNLPVYGQSLAQLNALGDTTTIHSIEKPKPLFVEQVKEAVEKFLDAKAKDIETSDQGRLEYSLKGLNKNLRMLACNNEVMVDFIHDDWLKNKSHLKATCPGENKSLLIGVELSLIKAVFVTQEAVSRMERIDHKISKEERNVLRLNQGYIEHPDELNNLVAKRNLRSGTPLHPQLLTKEILVARNSLVSIEASVAGIAVRAQGTALDKGAAGEVIRVRNNRSNRIVNAKVVNRSLVEVQL